VWGINGAGCFFTTNKLACPSFFGPYRYLNTGDGNLVVLRVAAGTRNKPKTGQAVRVTPTGEEILGGSVENKSLPPIEDADRFFADSAG